jgi:hypothetical protein
LWFGISNCQRYGGIDATVLGDACLESIGEKEPFAAFTLAHRIHLDPSDDFGLESVETSEADVLHGAALAAATGAGGSPSGDRPA